MMKLPLHLLEKRVMREAMTPESTSALGVLACSRSVLCYSLLLSKGCNSCTNEQKLPSTAVLAALNLNWPWNTSTSLHLDSCQRKTQSSATQLRPVLSLNQTVYIYDMQTIVPVAPGPSTIMHCTVRMPLPTQLSLQPRAPIGWVRCKRLWMG